MAEDSKTCDLSRRYVNYPITDFPNSIIPDPNDIFPILDSGP